MMLVCVLAITCATAASAEPDRIVSLNASIPCSPAAAALAKSYYEQQKPLSACAGRPVPCGLCDHYVGVWYGKGSSGFASANDHFAKTPASHKLPGWKPGALAFWTGGKY